VTGAPFLIPAFVGAPNVGQLRSLQRAETGLSARVRGNERKPRFQALLPNHNIFSMLYQFRQLSCSCKSNLGLVHWWWPIKSMERLTYFIETEKLVKETEKLVKACKRFTPCL